MQIPKEETKKRRKEDTQSGLCLAWLACLGQVKHLQCGPDPEYQFECRVPFRRVAFRLLLLLPLPMLQLVSRKVGREWFTARSGFYLLRFALRVDTLLMLINRDVWQQLKQHVPKDMASLSLSISTSLGGTPSAAHCAVATTRVICLLRLACEKPEAAKHSCWYQVRDQVGGSSTYKTAPNLCLCDLWRQLEEQSQHAVPSYVVLPRISHSCTTVSYIEMKVVFLAKKKKTVNGSTCRRQRLYLGYASSGSACHTPTKTNDENKTSKIERAHRIRDACALIPEPFR